MIFPPPLFGILPTFVLTCILHLRVFFFSFFYIFFKHVKSVLSDFHQPDNPLIHSSNLQKHISKALKPTFFPWDLFTTLSHKANLTYFQLTPPDIKALVKRFSKSPLIVSSAFFKTICNALCTTAAFHNDVISPCFAGGKGRDDQFHFLRCTEIA